METSADPAVAGADLNRPINAIFINAPLRHYSLRPRVNDFTLPVLGMGHIATYAARHGFNVGVLDAEAHGLSIEQTTQLINQLTPRWAGFNLLAPTYQISARIAAGLDPAIQIMVGATRPTCPPSRDRGRVRTTA
jgi:anaerobic magnesium-protoporphyrin IX monomethyl ester cyclase